MVRRIWNRLYGWVGRIDNVSQFPNTKKVETLAFLVELLIYFSFNHFANGLKEFTEIASNSFPFSPVHPISISLFSFLKLFQINLLKALLAWQDLAVQSKEENGVPCYASKAFQVSKISTELETDIPQKLLHGDLCNSNV